MEPADSDAENIAKAKHPALESVLRMTSQTIAIYDTILDSVSLIASLETMAVSALSKLNFSPLVKERVGVVSHPLKSTPSV
jgi:hypothetical protein